MHPEMAAAVGIPAALLPIQLYTSALGKVEEDDPRAWAPATQMGDLDGAPGSWPQLLCIHLGSEAVDRRSLCVTLPFRKSVFKQEKRRRGDMSDHIIWGVLECWVTGQGPSD